MSFGNRMKQAREKKGLTQRELASLLNLQVSTVSLYETNKREPRFETIKDISRVLDVSADWLFSRTNDSPENDFSNINKNQDITRANTVGLDSLLEIILILKDWPDMVDILRRLGEKTTPEERRKIARIIKAAIIDTDDPPK
jgi:transcriptional regulator with XRE-family HTH domain